MTGVWQLGMTIDSCAKVSIALQYSLPLSLQITWVSLACSAVLPECRAEYRRPCISSAGFDGLSAFGRSNPAELCNMMLEDGIIIHVQVGDLRVHKVALLQAKVSQDGNANIGSMPSGPSKLTQLQKLRDPNRDFFLFYHTGSSASPVAVPTVTPVTHFVRTNRLDEASLARNRIPVDATSPRLQ